MSMNDREFLVRKIRAEYTEKEHTRLDELKALDTKVKRPANVLAYIFGSLAAIVMGSGMSLVMTDIGELLGLGNAMLSGVAIGVVGMVMALLTYPLYKAILASRKAKYGKQILKLSEELMTEE